MKYGIRRERTQLVLIEDFVRVITNNNTDKNPIETREFQKYEQIFQNRKKKIIYLVSKNYVSKVIEFFVVNIVKLFVYLN
jgi:hypothetical protein